MQRIRRWLRPITSERGSQGLEAAGVAVAVAIIAVALIGAATSILAPGIERGLNCAVQTVLGGGGCGGGATATNNANTRSPAAQNAASNDSGEPGDVVPVSAAGGVSKVDLDEWTAQHIAVQEYFVTNIRPGAQMEVPIPGSGPNGGTGRADIVAGNEIWEVKPARPWWMDGTGQAQLQRYLENRPGSVPGAPYEEFVVPYGANQEIVVKSYGQPGMLYYYVRNKDNRRPQPEPRPVPVPVPAPQPQPNDDAVKKGVIIGGGVIGGGALLWWLGKLASPLCGPAAPACAIVL